MRPRTTYLEVGIHMKGERRIKQNIVPTIKHGGASHWDSENSNDVYNIYAIDGIVDWMKYFNLLNTNL
jgi:hypothetical protein